VGLTKKQKHDVNTTTKKENRNSRISNEGTGTKDKRLVNWLVRSNSSNANRKRKEVAIRQTNRC
jgi:hypothetical protein